MTLAPDKPTTTTNTVRNAEASLPVTRFFTKPETDPYDEIAWEIRSAVIAGQDGKPVFEQHEVAFPEPWTQNATTVVASQSYRRPPVHAAGQAGDHSGQHLLHPGVAALGPASRSVSTHCLLRYLNPRCPVQRLSPIAMPSIRWMYSWSLIIGSDRRWLRLAVRFFRCRFFSVLAIDLS